MRQTLQFFSAMVQVIALLVAVLSLSSFIEDKGRAASAVQDAARADVTDVIGRVHFERAEQEERAAEAAATEDAVALGLAMITLLLAAGVWLLASIARSLTEIRLSAAPGKEPSDERRPENAPIAA